PWSERNIPRMPKKLFRVAAALALMACGVVSSTPDERAAARSDPLNVVPVPFYRTATTAQQLVSMLNEPSPGEIVIPDGVAIDLGAYKSVPLKAGVHLRGMRSGLTEGGRVYSFDQGWNTPDGGDPNYTLFEVQGDDVHIEGLRIEGPWKLGDNHVIPSLA